MLLYLYVRQLPGKRELFVLSEHHLCYGALFFSYSLSPVVLEVNDNKEPKIVVPLL